MQHHLPATNSHFQVLFRKKPNRPTRASMSNGGKEKILTRRNLWRTGLRVAAFCYSSWGKSGEERKIAKIGVGEMWRWWWSVLEALLVS